MTTILLFGVLVLLGSAAADAAGVDQAFGLVPGLVVAFFLSRALLRWLSVRALSVNS